jgi:predicted transcriptional regulator
MTYTTPTGDLLDLTAQIVSAHVSNNSVPPDSLPALIHSVFNTLAGVGVAVETPAAERPQPAVPIKKSVFPDYIVCLEDGKKLKMLKRHLATTYNMTPAEYRARWGLPHDYPMVSPNYAETRSRLAKELGLGRKPVPEVVAEPAPVPVRRGRKSKSVSNE